MAVVSRDSAANLGKAPPMGPQVEDRIASVYEAYDKALEALEGGLFGQSDIERTASHNVRQFRGKVDDWAKRGRAAVASSGSPGTRGWPGWVEAGNIWISGFKTQAQFDHENLELVVEAVREAPATTVRAVKKAAAEVEQIGQRAALGILWPVGAALAAYVALRLTVLR